MAPVSRSNSSSGTPRPLRRRMRMINSCFECRRRKQKCTKHQPCEKCLDFGRECTYLSQTLDDIGRQRFNDVKNKVGSLERTLERNMALRSSTASKVSSDLVIDSVGFEDGYEVQIQPGDMLTSETIQHMRQDESSADVVDVVLRIDRIHLHARTEALMLARFTADKPNPDDLNDALSAASAGSNFPNFMQFSTDCIMPFSGNIFGMESDSVMLKSLIPHRPTADMLVARYFRSVHLLCPCLDQREFDRTYKAFWESLERNIEPSPKTYCWVFAVFFAASVSQSKTDYPLIMGKPDLKSGLYRFKTGVEIALCRAEFMRGSSFEVFQAYVIYLLATVRTEISRAHSISIGMALRIAECMGLGKDGEYFHLTPMEIQLRRLIWYQLCFMDVRTSESQGPRPYIRRDDFNTKLPVNIENELLETAETMPAPVERWTPMTLSLIRFEVNEVARAIWADRQKPECRRATITEMLSRVDEFWKLIVSRYDSFMQLDVPVQKYTRLAYHLQMYRLYVVVLMRYNTQHSAGLPAKLNSVMVRACIMICELTIQLDTDPMFADWKWYLGAYTQYQPALVLAREIYDNPGTSEADRIWACLSHAFIINPNDSREQQIEAIMARIVTKLHIYRSLRMPAWTARSRQMGRQKGEKVEKGKIPSHLDQTDPCYQQGQRSTASALPTEAIPSYVADTGPSLPSPASSSLSHLTQDEPWVSDKWPQRPVSVPSTFVGQSQPLPQLLQPLGHPPGPHNESQMLLDVDWETINNIFQQDPHTGELILVGYDDMSLSTQPPPVHGPHLQHPPS
ncbi:putative transcriptional regulatory protein [Ceratocystis fimbriata CBS 114723]|uniref:Putative transcriptional regulatory protein n=1 Tax=Ceratocystis fimbriata CBS 114723 TaxID=1035309 RepID=A0A2C5X3I7_9PEZI|nr:putative transcriptional regulatory protein [Ceratocystis fimbriata CBS 114723]